MKRRKYGSWAEGSVWSGGIGTGSLSWLFDMCQHLWFLFLVVYIMYIAGHCHCLRFLQATARSPGTSDILTHFSPARMSKLDS